MSKPHQCEEQLSSVIFGQFHQCSRRGVLHEKKWNAKKQWFCKQHAPSTREARYAIHREKYDAKRKLHDLQDAVSAAERAIVEYVMSEAFLMDDNTKNAIECEKLRTRAETARQALAAAQEAKT